ncbi:hypothetical protein [Nocardia cyriacigeorgica]|uniref:hypothetical protein n=1 Tax=Nocardia cyriacigeorgica TaxID=135487 RepID=UPI0024559987|nr:hypothetical protein [Nocardia cyriacigeorgica]
MHLSVNLYGVRMDFAACLTAALIFVQEWQIRHHPNAVAVIHGSAAGLARLPAERLYLEP